MPGTAILPRPKIRTTYTYRGGTEALLVGACDSCGRRIYPSYTDDAPNGVPELFEIDAITRVTSLCTGCLSALGDAIYAALQDRLVTAEGGPL